MLLPNGLAYFATSQISLIQAISGRTPAWSSYGQRFKSSLLHFTTEAISFDCPTRAAVHALQGLCVD